MITKKTLLIVLFTFIFVGIINALNDRSSNKDTIDKLMLKIEESIKNEMYYHSYLYIDEALIIIEDKRQLKKLYKYISKLKEECPQKPLSICESLEKKIEKGHIVQEEELYWYNCTHLKK